MIRSCLKYCRQKHWNPRWLDTSLRVIWTSLTLESEKIFIRVPKSLRMMMTMITSLPHLENIFEWNEIVKKNFGIWNLDRYFWWNSKNLIDKTIAKVDDYPKMAAAWKELLESPFRPNPYFFRTFGSIAVCGKACLQHISERNAGVFSSIRTKIVLADTSQTFGLL